MNHLYYGDCLTIMQEMEDESVDLIYLDPPFNSDRDYHAIYKDETGRQLPDQIEEFRDQWTLDEERERVIHQLPLLMRQAGLKDSAAEFWQAWTNALRYTQPSLLAFLSYLVERLLPMKRLLRPHGSIYLHCDPTASHYLKLMLDAIFGHQNFLNEVIWHYGKWTNAASHFQRNHDVILVYARRKGRHTFNKLYQKEQGKHYEKGWHTNVVKGVSQLIVYDRKKSARKIASEKYDKVIYREGKTSAAASDVWNLPIINPMSKERLGYRTQKPLHLLERIVQASSQEGDVVFDPFCGCATTLEAAQRLGRQWIGIDIAIHAIKRVAKVRLEERMQMKEGEDFTIEGIPRDLEGAQDLWKRDPYHFQKWCIEQVDGFVTTKSAADGGIDGRLYFDMPGVPDLQSMLLEVKGRKNIGVADLRALQNVMVRDNSPLAGVIVMTPLDAVTAGHFHDLMSTAGELVIEGRTFPRLQMLTIPEILNGKRFNTPLLKGKSESIQPKLV